MNAGDATTVWEWDLTAGTFVPVVNTPAHDDPDVEPLVADSWLVTDGAVRGFARHRRRFERACGGAVAIGHDTAAAREAPGGAAVTTVMPRVTEELIAPVSGDHFWSSLAALIPRTGAWFPRVELVTGLRVLVRPAPERKQTVTVWDPQEADPREYPRVKGPDLPYLGLLREEARTFGADEALLTDAAGHVVEAAHANILWWDGKTLCAPHADSPVFSGITAGLIIEEARQRRISVEARRVTRSELQNREVWLTNALHGIRAVTAWRGNDVNSDAGAIDGNRLREWRHWWDQTATSLG